MSQGMVLAVWTSMARARSFLVISIPIQASLECRAMVSSQAQISHRSWAQHPAHRPP